MRFSLSLPSPFSWVFPANFTLFPLGSKEYIPKLTLRADWLSVGANWFMSLLYILTYINFVLPSRRVKHRVHRHMCWQRQVNSYQTKRQLLLNFTNKTLKMFASCRDLTDHDILPIKLCNDTWEFPEQFFLSHATTRRQSTVKRLISIQNNSSTKGQENLLPNPNTTVFFFNSIIPDMPKEQLKRVIVYQKLSDEFF